MIDEIRLTEKSSLLIPILSLYGTINVFLLFFAGDIGRGIEICTCTEVPKRHGSCRHTPHDLAEVVLPE